MPRESYEQLKQQRDTLREELREIRQRCADALRQTRREPTKLEKPREPVTGEVERIAVLTEWPKDWLELIDEIVQDRGEESRSAFLRECARIRVNRLRSDVKLSEPPQWGGRSSA